MPSGQAAQGLLGGPHELACHDSGQAWGGQEVFEVFASGGLGLRFWVPGLGFRV